MNDFLRTRAQGKKAGSTIAALGDGLPCPVCGRKYKKA